MGWWFFFFLDVAFLVQLEPLQVVWRIEICKLRTIKSLQLAIFSAFDTRYEPGVAKIALSTLKDQQTDSSDLLYKRTE